MGELEDITLTPEDQLRLDSLTYNLPAGASYREEGWAKEIATFARMVGATNVVTGPVNDSEFWTLLLEALEAEGVIPIPLLQTSA